MYSFFVKESKVTGDSYKICGADYNHIVNVLRMAVNDEIIVNYNKKSSLCKIVEINKDSLTAKIQVSDYNDGELPIELFLFQGLPKGDKLELIIQKAVELGVNNIIPVETSRSVVKIDQKKEKAKVDRWQAISESAAKQSKRNVVPKIYPPMSVKDSLGYIEKLDILLVPYENKQGMLDTKKALLQIEKGNSVGVFIGPEGGISQEEIDILGSLNNAKIISLGKRILRTETAAISALSMVMTYCEMSL